MFPHHHLMSLGVFKNSSQVSSMGHVCKRGEEDVKCLLQ